MICFVHKEGQANLTNFADDYTIHGVSKDFSSLLEILKPELDPKSIYFHTQ